MTDKIWQKLDAVGKYVSYLGYRPIYVALYGSQNYGLDVHTAEYESDFDYKVIVVPSLWDLVRDSQPVSTVVDYEGGHIDIKDIRAYMDTAMKLNPAYIEIMLTDNWLCLHEGSSSMPPFMSLMRKEVPGLIKGMAPLFVKAAYGMFLEKKKAMCHPYPTIAWKIDKWGYDGKQVHHMYRLLLMLRHFRDTGKVSLFPPENERAFMIALKLNRYSLAEVSPMIEEWEKEITALRSELEAKYPTIDPAPKQRMIELSRQLIYDRCVEEAKYS